MRYKLSFLSIFLLIAGYFSYKADNTPLSITLGLLLVFFTYLIFFGKDKVEKKSGSVIYIWALLLNIATVIRFTTRGYKIHYLAIFLLGTLYLILLVTRKWFKEVGSGTKYYAFLVFGLQMLYSIYIIGITQSFLDKGAFLFLVHGIIILTFIGKAESGKKKEKKKDDTEGKEKEQDLQDTLVDIWKDIFREINSGHLRNDYVNVFRMKLKEEEIDFDCYEVVPIKLDDKDKDVGLRADVIVDDKIIVQIFARDMIKQGVEIKKIKDAVLDNLLRMLNIKNYKKGLFVDCTVKPFDIKKI